MKKYLIALKLGFAEMFAYRTQMIIWSFVSLIPPLFSFYVFKNLGEKVDQNYITAYFLLVGIIQTATFIVIDGLVTEMIFSGQISFFLVKPVSFSKLFLARYCTSPIIKLILGLPIILLLIFLLISNGLINFNLINFLILPFVLLGGFLISFSICLMIGYASFWFSRVYFITDLNIAVFSLFSGSSLPLFIFPEEFENIINYLPFRFLIDFPIDIILEKHLPEFHYFLIFIFYIIIFWLISQFVLKKGLKVYESFGN